MTNAELKTICNLLGIQRTQLAKIAGVSDRAVDYWMSGGKKGHTPVPEDVEQAINDYLLWARDFVAYHTDIAVNTGRGIFIRFRTDDDLWKFHPELKALKISANMHGAAIGRVWENYHLSGNTARIEYMNSKEYLNWLNGQNDNYDLRLMWAEKQSVIHKTCG